MLNVIIIVALLIAFCAMFYFFFLKKEESALISGERPDECFNEEFLRDEIVRSFDTILRTDYASLNLNKVETEKNERNKIMLHSATKLCSCGDYSSKSYVKDCIKDLLQRKLHFTEENQNKVIHFDDPLLLSAQDKFEILLYLYEKKYNDCGFEEMMLQNGLDNPIGAGGDMHFEVTCADIDTVFRRHAKLIAALDYYDKLNIVTQREYQLSYGLGVIDSLRDMKLDGINCGTSGYPSSFFIRGMDAMYGAKKGELPLTACNAVWVIFKGKLIHMSCLGFGSDKELIRVAKRVFRYDNPGTLDAETGYIVNYMKDGMRVSVARPKTCETWTFFLRNLSVAAKMKLNELYPYNGVDKLITLVRYLVLGKRNIAITGPQYSGKSTALMSMIRYFPAAASIRVMEMAFELYLRRIYPEKNIVTFKEAGDASAASILDFMKKTDCDVMVLGEIAQAVLAAWAIEAGEVGGSQFMFTNHAKTAKDLIEYCRNSTIKVSGFNNEKLIDRMCARILNFDIHLEREFEGKRYPSRITQILPSNLYDYPSDLTEATKEYYYRRTDRREFDDVDIMRFEDNEFIFTNPLNEFVVKEIYAALPIDERDEFLNFTKQIEAEAKVYQSKHGIRHKHEKKVVDSTYQEVEYA